MKRFKNGDRVVGKIGRPYIGGKVGTVIKPATLLHYDYGVQFDDLIENGHDLGDLDKLHSRGHCRWVNDAELDPAPYFADARVGDSVYDMAYGEGKIKDVHIALTRPVITIIFKGYHTVKSFYINGAEAEGNNQTLFYSKPIFDLPPPPRRMVKKVIEGWENLYCDVDGFRGGIIFRTREIADINKSPGRLGPAIFIRHEYEGADPPVMLDDKGNRSIFDDVDD